MKKSGKKLLAGAAALAMSCSMVTGWANGVEIVDVKVLNSASDTGTSFKNAATGAIENVKLNTEQMLQVTVKLTDGATGVAAGDVTFLSNINGETTLDNGTIQYVDQQTVADGTATITFRPRTTVNSTEANTNNVTAGLGTFVAKAGGTDVSETASFNYTVETPKKDMTVSPESVTIKSGESAVFTVPEGMTNVVVKEGSTALTSNYEGTTLTITGLTEVKTHELVISAAGYNDKAVTVVVNSAVVEIPEGEVGNVDTALGEGLKNVTQGGTSAELPAKAGNYDVAYSIPDGAPNKDKVTLTNNTITLNDNVFAAKVTVTASVGMNGQVTDTKDIYLVKDSSKNISFGNLDLISDSNGADAFASSTALSNAALTETQMTGIKAEALNYALDRRTPDAAINSAIDYDLNGDVTLSEYRMLKLMFEGATGFGADNMVSSRQTWIDKANPSSAE